MCTFHTTKLTLLSVLFHDFTHVILSCYSLRIFLSQNTLGKDDYIFEDLPFQFQDFMWQPSLKYTTLFCCLFQYSW